MRRLAMPLLLVLLASVPLAVCAQVYTWTDASGTVHYSGSPPAHGVKYKEIHINGSSAPIVVKPATNKDNNAESDKTKPATQPKRVTDTPSNRKKLCDNLTANLKLLKGNNPVVVNGAKGKSRVLTADQRAKEKAKMQKQYKQYCKA